MSTSTSNFGLTKPAVNSSVDQDLWGTELNGDLDNIDTILNASLGWIYTAKSVSFSITAPTAASSTIADAKKLFICDATGGAIVATLPAAATSTNMVVAVKKKDSSANAVTITANGAELIDGSNTLALGSQYNWAMLVCDGTGWQVISKTTSSTGGKLTNYQVTDSTDISLSQIPTQTNVGSTLSVTIPTKGHIMFIFTGRLASPSGSGSTVLGIRIGSTNYWPALPNSSDDFLAISMTGAGTVDTHAYGTVVNGGSPIGGMIAGIDVEGNSIPTGSQTVQIVAAKFGSTSGVTIKGTAVTTRIYVHVFDNS